MVSGRKATLDEITKRIDEVEKMSTQQDSSSLSDFNKLWDFNDPAGTEAKFRELLPAAEAADNDSLRLQLITQIARTQGLQRKFSEAHETLNQVESHLDSAEAVVEVRYLLERGRVHNSSQQPEQAKPLFESAWERAKAAGEENYAVDAAHMLAIVEEGQAALEWNERAMAFAEAAQDPAARRWLGTLYNNIGWTYHDQGEYQKALILFEKALAWFTENGGPVPQRIARWTVARTYRSLGRIEEALAAQQKLLEDLEAAQETDGFVFEELAECHLVLKHTDDAKKYFALAHEQLSKDEWLTKSEPERIQRLSDLATQE